MKQTLLTLTCLTAIPLVLTCATVSTAAADLLKPQIKASDNRGNGVAVNGRIQIDSVVFDDDTVDLDDDTDLRRLYLGVKGTIAHDIAYQLTGNFTGSDAKFNDATLAYTGFDNLYLIGGHHEQIIGMEDYTSSLHLSFAERSIVHDAFYPGDALGALANFHGTYGDAGQETNWQIGLGAYKESLNGNGNSDNSRQSYGTRIGYNPYIDDRSTLHLGGAIRYADSSIDNDFDYDARPGTRLATSQFADVTVNNADHSLATSLEMIYLRDNYHLQAEYITTTVDTNTGADPRFDGWYAQASYYVTGENRSYNPSRGGVGRLTPNDPITDGGFGAVELAARYATIDLNDTGFNGGELDTINLAVNWYPTSNTRLDLNYVRSETSNTGPVPNDTTNAFIVRAQYDF